MTGRVEASLSEFTSDGFTLSVNQHDQNVVVIYTAYRTGEVTNDLTDLSHDQLIDIDPGDHHSRYTDSEASAAAPVQDVEGKTGNVTLGPGDVEAEPSGSVEDHRQNETHATAQPPETHGDTEHDNTVPSQSDVDAKADNPHGNAAHTTNFVPSSDVTDIVVDQTNKVINFKTT